MITQKNILSNQILKKSSAEKIDKFLKKPEKTLKKRQLTKISKRKTSIAKSNHKIIVISTLVNFGKQGLPILILKTKISIFDTKKIDSTIIGADAYWIACKLKKTWLFAISIKDLKYQSKNKIRPKTNPRTIVLK